MEQATHRGAVGASGSYPCPKTVRYRSSDLGRKAQCTSGRNVSDKGIGCAVAWSTSGSGEVEGRGGGDWDGRQRGSGWKR